MIFLFVSLPSDTHAEASEQRIRMRAAVVSALSTAGYRPISSSRLGLAVWDANITPRYPAITTQTAYPYEVFRLDSERRALESDRKIVGKPAEIVVLYVEENSLKPEYQLEWLKQVSRHLSGESQPELLNQQDRIIARWLRPNIRSAFGIASIGLV